MLIFATVALYVAAGLAILFRRTISLAGCLMAAGSAISLALFWWIWPGLEPEPGNYWRGPLFSAAFLAIAPLVVLAGRDARTFAGSHFARGRFATWGTTPEERADEFPCDSAMPEANCFYWRGIDVDAPAEAVYNWLGMTRVAPYSNDLLDNHGHRSPRELDDSLPPLAPGQSILGPFEVLEAVPGRGFTAVSSKQPPTAITYRISDAGNGRVRLVVKLAAHCESRLGAMSLGFFDWVMMRKQLRTLARLSGQSSAPIPAVSA